MAARRIAALALVASALGVGTAPAAALAAPPTLGAEWVTDVTASSAGLRAEVNPEGLATSYRFEYVSEASYEESGFAGATFAPLSGAAQLGGGTEAVKVFQHLGSLIPAASYRYRVRAQSSGGVSLGPARLLGTEESGVTFHLPDSRAWELASPTDKGGGAIGSPGSLFGGGDFQAARASSAVTYSSATAFGSPRGAPPASQYLATRAATGWGGASLSPALFAGAYGDRPDGVPFRLFSEDLARAVFDGGDPCGAEPGCADPLAPPSGSGAPVGVRELYLRDSSTGSYTALATQAALSHSAVSPTRFEAKLVAATPDLAHLVISTCAKLTANAAEVLSGPGECDPFAQNLYEWSGGSLTLVNLLPGESTSTPGAAIAASLGAISQDGSRVYFSAGDDGPLYLREGAQTKLLPETSGGGAAFQAASADGSVAFFTKSGHLYRYLATSQAATDLTPSGGVAGVLGIAADGTYAYYQDGTGLWQWHEGALAEVAAGSQAAGPADFPPASGAARVSPGGVQLAFLSSAELAGYESAGHVEAYLWAPPPGGGPPRLLCASCNPTGERPEGDASLPGALPGGAGALSYLPRSLSLDGQRLFFDSSDRLSPFDTNSTTDAYQWEAQGQGGCARELGCIALISSGREPGGATFLDASAEGSDAYFLTEASLLGVDPGSIDVYDARVGGGFAESSRPSECIGDSCQPLPGEPEDPNPTTLLRGPENPALHYKSEKKQHKAKGKHKKPRRHHKQGGRK